MARLLKFNTDSGEVLIATPVPAGMVSPTGKLEDSIEAVQASLGEALGVVTAIGRSFQGTITEVGADSAELELGLQFTVNGKIYVVEAEGSASLKVKLTFSTKS